jgi:tetratricopeptide (TPR) repeat protein
MNKLTSILKFYILTFVIFCNFNANANNALDSLLNDLKKQKQDTSQIKTLFEIVDLLINEKNPDAKKYAAQAYEKSLLVPGTKYFNQAVSLFLSTIEKDQTQNQKFQFLDKLLMNTYNDYAKKSILYMYKSLMLEGIDSNIKAANIYELASQAALKSKDTLTIIDVFTSKGIFYKRKSNNTLALEALITALRYSEYSEYNDGIFPICINLGTIYEQMFELNKALELYRKAEKKISNENDLNGNAIVNYKIGKVLLKQLKYKEAEEKLKKVYEIHIQRDDKKGLIVSAAALSGVYFDLKQYDDFLYFMNISLENAKLTNDQQGLASAYSTYGRYYSDVKNDYPKALEYYKKNLTLNTGKIQLSHLNMVYKKLYILYEKLGDYKNAFNYYNLYSNSNDSLYSSNNVKKQTELNLNYEFDKIQRQKEIENKVKESEQKLLLEKEKQRRNFFIIVGILALFLLFLSYRSYIIKSKCIARKTKT